MVTEVVGAGCDAAVAEGARMASERKRTSASVKREHSRWGPGCGRRRPWRGSCRASRREFGYVEGAEFVRVMAAMVSMMRRLVRCCGRRRR